MERIATVMEEERVALRAKHLLALLQHRRFEKRIAVGTGEMFGRSGRTHGGSVALVEKRRLFFLAGRAFVVTKTAHIFWDAFTHDEGWFVQRISWLRDPALHLGSATFGLPFVLQALSTFVGFATLAIAHFLWLRRQRLGQPADSESDGWHYPLGIAICAVALLIALPAAVHFAASPHGILFVRAVLFGTAIYAPAIAVPLGLLATSVIYLRRQRVR